MKKQSLVVLDVLGISSATLCMIHCLLFPLLSIIPLGFSNNHWVDTFFACIGMFVVSKILMSNASLKVKIILGVSILFIVVSVTLEILFNFNSYLLYIGGIGMIIGHSLNYKNHKH